MNTKVFNVCCKFTFLDGSKFYKNFDITDGIFNKTF